MLAACCLLLSACDNSSIGIIGGSDEQTSIYVKSNGETIKGQFGEQYEKKPIRMFNVNGDLYFDSGLVSNKIPRCATPDGELKNVVRINPANQILKLMGIRTQQASQKKQTSTVNGLYSKNMMNFLKILSHINIVFL